MRRAVVTWVLCEEVLLITSRFVSSTFARFLWRRRDTNSAGPRSASDSGTFRTAGSLSHFAINVQ